jgi:hypothetical protein
MLVPLLFMTLPTLDMSMVVFLRTTMPEAEREGPATRLPHKNVTGSQPGEGSLSDEAITAVLGPAEYRPHYLETGCPMGHLTLQTDVASHPPRIGSTRHGVGAVQARE